MFWNNTSGDEISIEFNLELVRKLRTGLLTGVNDKWTIQALAN